jgi:hypothetical protein
MRRSHARHCEGCAAAHDFAGDSLLIGHPQATSFLNIFSIFPMGPGCWQLG